VIVSFHARVRARARLLPTELAFRVGSGRWRAPSCCRAPSGGGGDFRSRGAASDVGGFCRQPEVVELVFC